MSAKEKLRDLDGAIGKAGPSVVPKRWRIPGLTREISWNFLAIALIGTLALGYLAGRGSLLFESAVNETAFRDRQSFSALDWAIEDFELRFEEQYTALIRTINAQTNWEIARRGPYHQWLAARDLPDLPSARELFKGEFEERLRSNRADWRALLENTVNHLRGSFALQRAEVDLLAFYQRLGMTNEFIGFYQDLSAKPVRPPGLSPFTRQYTAWVAQGARAHAPELARGDVFTRTKAAEGWRKEGF